MNKKMILSAVMATSVLLTSCGRDDEPTKAITHEGNPTAPAKPNEPAPKPAQPAPQPSKPEEKPADSYIGTRGYAQKWKDGIDPLNELDIVALYNNPSSLVEKIKELVVFAATEPEGTKYYILKDEDLQHLGIEDIHYNGNSISFKTTYKGVKSNVPSSLSFNARDYYERKITVNTAYVSSKYMRGSYENLFIGSLLNIDTNIYEVELSQNGKSNDDYLNKIRLYLELTDKRTKKTISISKTISGFKTLKQLADDLSIVHTSDFRTAVQEKISKLKDKNKTDLTPDLRGSFNNNWRQYILMELKSDRHRLRMYNDIIEGGQGHLDIYLDKPRFILASAKMQGNDLHIKIQFQQANEQPINKEYSIIINNVKS